MPSHTGMRLVFDKDGNATFEEFKDVFGPQTDRVQWDLHTEGGRIYIGEAELDPDHPEEWGTVILAVMAEAELLKET